MCRREICWRRSTLAPTRLNSIRPRRRRRKMRHSLRMPGLSSRGTRSYLRTMSSISRRTTRRGMPWINCRHLVAADQAAIENAQTQLDYARITAPISGRVGIRLVDAGNIVRSTDTAGMLTINQVQPISVVFTLPQQELRGRSRCHTAEKDAQGDQPWIGITSPSSQKELWRFSTTRSTPQLQR